MSHNSHDRIFGRYQATDASASSETNNATPRCPNSSSILLRAFPDSTNVNPRPVALTCPVLGCSVVFKGKIPHGYLWRHLKRPGVHGLASDEKLAWKNLHKIHHDRLLITRSITLSSQKLTPGALTDLT